jgi:hypothetical protein
MSGSNQLPPVLRTAPLDRPMNQEVNTDILRPVNFSQKGAKWVFDRKGILDSNSQLQMAVTVTDSGVPGDTGAYLATATGALSQISRAWLTIGGKTISDLRDLGHYATWVRLHYSNDYKKGIIMPKQGGDDIFEGSTARDIMAPGATAVSSRGFNAPFGVLGRVSSEYAINDSDPTVPSYGKQDADQTNSAERASRQLTASASTTPTWAVGLSQLIPFLQGLQLPLFAIQEEVALNVEWSENKAGHSFQTPSSVLVPDNCSRTIVEDKVLIMVDYLFYPDQLAEVVDVMMQKGGYNVPYTEQLVSENNVTNTASATNEITFNIQLAGKRLKSLVVQKQLVETPGADEYIDNQGRYNSMAYVNNEDVNFQINARNFYSLAISNPSQQKTEADEVLRVPLNLCGARYSWGNIWNGTNKTDNPRLSNRLRNGYANDAEQGTSHWLGFKIENSFGQGRRISNIPIEYRETVEMETTVDEDGLSRRYRVFSGVQKIANISGGFVTVIE